MTPYQTFRGNDAIQFCKINLDLPKEMDLQSIHRIETYSASLAEDGEDFCEIRVINTEEQIVFVDRVFSFKTP